jgi:hypothetical protein
MDNDIHEIALFLTGQKKNGWTINRAKKLKEGKWILVLEKPKSQEATNENN